MEKEERAVRRSPPVLLLNLTLADVTPKQFVNTFWTDPEFYSNFLVQTGASCMVTKQLHCGMFTRQPPNPRACARHAQATST